MDCKHFRTQHLAYLDDGLSSDEMAAAQFHVMRCDPCAMYDTMVRRSLMVARSVPSIAPSEAFRQTLQQRLATCRAEIDKDATGSSDRLQLLRATGRHPFRPSRAVMAVAASAVLGVLVYRAIIVGREPSLRMQPMTAARPMPVSPLLAQQAGFMTTDTTVNNQLWPAPVLIPETPLQSMSSGFSLVATGH